MRVKNWIKVTVVVMLIMTFVFSYSLFFIDFSQLGRQPSQQQFQGPEENPPADFQLPEEIPSSNVPTSKPPLN